MNPYLGLAKTVNIIAVIIAAIVFVAIPAGFFSISYKHQSAEVLMEAGLGADVVSEIIYANPGLWQFNEHRLVGALRQIQSRVYSHHTVITDEQGKVIATLPVDLALPLLSRSVDLFDSDKVVGKITVAESMRPLLIDTALVGLISALLALAIYFAVKLLPFRALSRVIAQLDASHALLRDEIQAKEHALLQAQNIGIAMRHQALHDGLTNLPNRILLHDRLQQAILIARREKKSLALAMMGLDQFKTINDTLGHHAGDLVLQQIATRLLQLLRGSDTVARLGGDEFAILLTSVHGAPGAVSAAQRILEAVREPLKIGGKTLHIDASLGIVLFPEHGEEPEKLMHSADIAMHIAKRGKTSFEIYDEVEDLKNVKLSFLQNDLYAAIIENQFVLHYQPKIDIVTNRICGVEALIRWQHPKEGLIFPDDFIPVAERNGLIKALTRMVLKMALQQLSDWQAQGIALPIAINISAVNLQDPSFPDQVEKIMADYAVSPTLIEMEVTETALMQDPFSAIETVKKLGDIGILVSIDDFGTGYSSMAYLKKLVVTKIKVDKSFVIDMIKNENDDIIVRSTIDLAHNLGLTVVAEGVETAEALDRLRALGCDTVQGYHMCRPVAIDILNEWLATSNWGSGKVD